MAAAGFIEARLGSSDVEVEMSTGHFEFLFLGAECIVFLLPGVFSAASLHGAISRTLR